MPSFCDVVHFLAYSCCYFRVVEKGSIIVLDECLDDAAFSGRSRNNYMQDTRMNSRIRSSTATGKGSQYGDFLVISMDDLCFHKKRFFRLPFRHRMLNSFFFRRATSIGMWPVRIQGTVLDRQSTQSK